MKNYHIISLLFVTLSLCLLSSCSGDEPRQPASKADVSFKFEPNDSFLEYFTILVYYRNAYGKDVVQGVERSPFVASLSYKSLPVQASVQFQFIRNNTPTPVNPTEFSFDLSKIVSVTSTGTPELSQQVETYSNTVAPQDFEAWAQTMTARNYVYSLSIDRSGVVRF